MENKQQLADAANALINDPQAPEMFKMLTEVAALPDRLKVKLADSASVLNPLLAVMRTDRPKFDKIVEIVTQRREARGLPPLTAPRVFDKNEYQRELMAERRVRQFKAADIENLRRPPSGQLVGAHRLEFMRVQQSKWMTKLNALLKASKEGATMTKAQRQALSAEFWRGVDSELESTEAAVYQWLQNGRRGECP